MSLRLFLVEATVVEQQLQKNFWASRLNEQRNAVLLAHRTVSPTILATALALATVAGTTASASSSVPSHTPVAVNHAGERFAYAST
ncbi:hypothetical protein [Streptomyces sp. MK5]|uniref:hypothetical protein n=1 Tax=Streptomyces sp. MK5 TaxID=3064253 RepID=UPI0027410FDE|nr:hypothetical protein [Streptomyces sp. MK5]